MANILDYVHWRGDLSFSKTRFNDIDNLILSQICYIDFTKAINKYPNEKIVTLKQASNIVFSNVKKEDMVLGLIVPNSIVDLCDNAKDSKRFGQLGVSNYINIVNNNNQCQFSAMCFHLPNNVIYIAFRGTDDTLIGWQENLNMLNTFPIPAQKKAASYINKIAALFPEGNLIIGGHSKGGNLAVYGAIYCNDEIKNRIIRVYSNDGPGFINDKIDLKKFDLIKEKIIRIIPESSIIGMIFNEYCNETKIVSSDVKGIRQHDGFSWQINPKSFVEVEKVNDNAVKFNNSMVTILSRLTDEEKTELANNVYNFIIELNKDTLLEVQKDSLRLIKYLNKISFKNRKMFMELIYNLIKYKQL